MAGCIGQPRFVIHVDFFQTKTSKVTLLTEEAEYSLRYSETLKTIQIELIVFFKLLPICTSLSPQARQPKLNEWCHFWLSAKSLLKALGSIQMLSPDVGRGF